MFYKIDSARVSWREYWWGSRSPAVLLGWLLKLLRVRLPSSTDDPNVDALAPFEVPETALPETVRLRFQPLIAEFAACGFHSPVFHAVADGFHSTRIYLATFLHESGEAVGRIHHRIWSYPHPAKTYLFPRCVSAFADGTFLESSAGKPDLAAPPGCRLNRQTDASVAALWASHQRELAAEAPGRQPRPVRDRAELLAVIERHHAAARDFHVQRGVFAPLTAAEEQRAVALTESVRVSEAGGLAHAEVLAELNQLQQRKTGWGNAILILVVSLLLFIGAGSAQWSWRIALMLVPVLLIHELGHYVAMRTFRYRNLRMFFLPFFGAAVSGRNYNVPGWKKAVVSLMGPVPGIVLGAVVGGVGMAAHQPLLLKAAVLMLILNGFNLLPVLPLDGGWVFHAVLFSRHYLLDTAFRLAAALALLAGGSFPGTRILMYLGIVMLVGLPAAYRMARITTRLRRAGVAPASPDDQTIPVDTAQLIIGEVKQAFPRRVTNKTLALYTLHIFETLNARPPGWLASLALLAAVAVSGLGAVLLGSVFVLAQQGNLAGMFAAAAQAPKHHLACGAPITWRGAAADFDGNVPATIIATFAARADAAHAFSGATNRLPATATARAFGDTVLVALPAAEEMARKEWAARWQGQAQAVLVETTNSAVRLRLYCVAPDAEVARAIEDDVQSYLSAPARMHLVPPWSGADLRTPEQRAQQRLARQTYGKLQRAVVQGYRDPVSRAMQQRLLQASRRADPAEMARLRAEYRHLIDRLNQRHLEEVVRDHRGAVDGKIVELWLALPKPAIGVAADQDLVRQLAERMGQLPLVQGRPVPGADRYSTRWGTVTRTGLMLRFDWLSFQRVGDGGPALVDWLCRQGCFDLKYEFQALGNPDEDGDD